jgi:hypothetical protein
MHTGGIFCSLVKAFDFVNHEILLAKFDFYCIRGQSEYCVRVYVTNRRQKVEIKSPNATKIFFLLTGVCWNMGYPKDQF